MATPDYAQQGFTAMRVELDAGVAIATLTRSKEYVIPRYDDFLHSPVLCRRNTFTGPLVKDLLHAFDLFDRDDRVRVVVLTAEPNAPAFCSGVRSTAT